MKRWTWAAASCRGTSHIKNMSRRQDAMTCTTFDEYLSIVISDGAGTAERGGEGASLICRKIGKNLKNFVETNKSIPDEEKIWTWIDEVRDAISYCAEKRSIKPKNFSATLIAAISNGKSTLTVHIGDGAAVAKLANTNEWINLSWPEHGEYASTTYFLTDDPPIKLKIYLHEFNIDAIAVFTDGIERIALDFSNNTPYQPFFNRMIGPLLESQNFGKDQNLSKHLSNFLNSENVNSRTDDDKTLILAALK